ncbi:hypothetical protein MCUN1_002680 [Malassezia cuniculi]|uniref:K Homology domain-containing protein n=1 Tax=Malassezia cuniculi TaxID=948313 RepID=A0AAF0EZX3_9BASI|nr:hypothetical protein MCUN1_002680 [Malassezia cuniculi]
MAAHQCLVSAAPREPSTPGTPGSLSPFLAPGAPIGPGRSARNVFSLCGTQTQVMGARGMILQELPVASHVVIKVPRAELVAAGSSSAPGSDALRPEVRSRLDDIMRASGTSISVSQLESRGADLGGGLQAERTAQLTISGSIESIEWARLQVLLVLDELSGLHVERIELEPKLMHVCGGRKRAALQSLEEETGASVYLPSPFAGALGANEPAAVVAARRTVCITGTYFQVQRARDALLQLAAARAKVLTTRQVVLVPRKADWLLTERLEELRTIMLDNSSFLEMPLLGSQQATVTIHGASRVDVERSIRGLMQLVAPFYVAHIWLLPGAYDALGISTKPDTALISQVLVHATASSGAEAVFRGSCIELYGPDAEVREAVRVLLALPALKHYHVEIRVQIELANEHREFISGKKNGKINKIMEQCDVRIKFEPFNDNNFFIEVSSTKIDGAMQGLGLLQEELPAEMSFHVPEAYHKRIIGVGGKNIQRIMKKYGVYVKFSNADEFAALGGYIDNDDNVIARTPSKNAVNLENLKASVMELVSPKDKDFVAASAVVPRQHQRLLLADRAAVLHDIERKTRCSVRFCRREAAADAVLLFGPDSQLDAAVYMLLQQIPLEAELQIPRSYELDNLLESSEFTALTERIRQENGVTVTRGAQSGSDAVIRITLPRSNADVLPATRATLDELFARHNVSLASAHSREPIAPPRKAANPFAAPLPHFATKLISPSALDAATDTLHQDTAATAASVAAVGTRYEDPSVGSHFGSFFDSGASTPNTHLASSFYTPSYSDGLAPEVWGAPLPQMSEAVPKSVFRPFHPAPGTAPFAFPQREGLQDASLDLTPHAPPFYGQSRLRRPQDGARASSMDIRAYGQTEPLQAPPLGRGSRAGDIDRFSSIDSAVSMSSLSPLRPDGASHRSDSASLSRVSPSMSASSTPADTMDEVSRVLAQIAFDK